VLAERYLGVVALVQHWGVAVLVQVGAAELAALVARCLAVAVPVQQVLERPLAALAERVQLVVVAAQHFAADSQLWHVLAGLLQYSDGCLRQRRLRGPILCRGGC
jgi:hypothetical protein